MNLVKIQILGPISKDLVWWNLGLSLEVCVFNQHSRWLWRPMRSEKHYNILIWEGTHDTEAKPKEASMLLSWFVGGHAEVKPVKSGRGAQVTACWWEALAKESEAWIWGSVDKHCCGRRRDFQIILLGRGAEFSDHKALSEAEWRLSCTRRKGAFAEHIWARCFRKQYCV